MYGIQTLNFQMNMLSHANRAWRSARYMLTPGADGAPATAATYWGKSAEVVEFTRSQLIFQFLTPHASELLPSRNCIPFYEMPVYRTTGLSQGNITALGNGEPDRTGRFFTAPTITLNSNNIQLSGIPDKLVIFVRRQMSALTCCDTDSFLTITGIRINFNNQAGLLSSMTPQQLYTNSVLSGSVSYTHLTLPTIYSV